MIVVKLLVRREKNDKEYLVRLVEVYNTKICIVLIFT